MSHLCDCISERNVDVNRPSGAQLSTSQPFRSKSSHNNRIQEHQNHCPAKNAHKQSSRHKQSQGEAGISSQTFTNSSISDISTQCQNLNINSESDEVEQGDRPSFPKKKNAKKKSNGINKLHIPQREAINIPQTSQFVMAQNEIASLQDFFVQQISPLYATTNSRYLENLRHHPQFQLSHNFQQLSQHAASLPNTPIFHLSQQQISFSNPNSPVVFAESMTSKYVQNFMQHPLLSKSFNTISGEHFQYSTGISVDTTSAITDNCDNSTPKHKKRNNKKKGIETSDMVFEPYLSAEVVEAGLRDNIFLEGVLRINPKQFQHSYVSSNDRSEQDILIDGIKNRNRALEGDVVVIQYIDSDIEENNEDNKLPNAIKKQNNKVSKQRNSNNKQKNKVNNKNIDNNEPINGDTKPVVCADNQQKNEVKDEDIKPNNVDNETIKLENDDNKQNNEDKESDEEKKLNNVENKQNSGCNKIKVIKQKKGKVVYIKERNHNRTCIGSLKLMPDKNRQRALFIPRDLRIPRLNILFTSWPDNFYNDSKKYENTLFLAKIMEWTDTRFAMGKIVSNIGQSGDMVTETKAILAQTDLEIEPFGPEVRHLYPRLDYKIPDDEISIRQDCRKMCVFSIDPFNCRDIDDAMSCRELENGNYEIGVHIADVAHFLAEDTILDEKVAEKATTIYLVEKAYHMLPDDLCLLCSLFPGVDKLAFSVFWEITKDAVVLSHRFSKTVINSCCQLAYEHAQAVLEDKDDSKASFPETYNGFEYEDIYKAIKIIGSIAAQFRKDRFDNGALRIDQPKVAFHLNAVNGLPDSFWIYENKESHQLIEEFMLLANMTVAERIHEDHPQLAFLRCHPKPSGYMLKQLVKSLKPMGIDLNIKTAGDLHRSLLPHVGPDCTDKGKVMVLNMLCAKPMARARYFCADGCDQDDFHHYALNVPLYTHFTSPIRRYADIMVHRLLAASLKYRPTPKWDTDKVRIIAAQCNKQKYNTKKASELSTEMYTLKYIETHSPFVTDAAVVEVREKYIDVIIIAMGLNRRIFFNNDFPGKYQCVKNEECTKLSVMELIWSAANGLPEVKQVVQVFSILQVELYRGDDMVKVETKLVRPQQATSS